MERKLAAILVADVVGYSGMMERDEAGTFTRLKAHRTELAEPTIAAHHGRIFKLTGDGLLAEFGSVVDAVECAAALQRGMAARGRDEPAEQRIVLRIGVHVGDVIVEGEDRHGDAVNVAARLQQLAEPGGICVSRTVVEQVKQKVALRFESRGEERLKNIAEPVGVYRARLDEMPHVDPGTLSPPDRPSIAVLPFANMSGDPEQEYFADGIVEEIITALSRMHWLFVIARNSSFVYRGRAVDVKQVGRELGVRYVLEGSVRRGGDKVRITGQLIDTASGAHLWADRFDGALEDIFDLQDRVTASVVGAIRPRLEKAEIERARRKPTENLGAYDYYLRGLAEVQRWNREGNDAALSLFHRAIGIDPEFAAAYGMAASCYLWRKGNGWTTDRAQDMAEAEQLARRAIELGKDDAVALCMAGIVTAYVLGRPEDGAAFIDQALALDPNYAAAWGFSVWARNWIGQPEIAIEHLARAVRLSPLDPLSYNWYSAAALAHFLVGRYDDACAWAERAVRAVPNYPSAIRVMAASHALAGRMDEAQRAATRVRQIDPDFRLSDLYDRAPIRRAEDLDRFAGALRKAGLPE